MAKDGFGYGTEENSSETYLDKFKEGEYEIEEGSVDLQEWRKTPWDMDKDIPLIKQALTSIFLQYHPDENPWYVPASSWDEKRDVWLRKILEPAQEKEGFPNDMTLRDFGLTDEILGHKSMEDK